MLIERRLCILPICMVLFLWSCMATACIFDEVSLDIQKVPVTIVKYTSKAKREINDGYLPLRIHLHFGPSESELAAFQAIKNVLQMAVSTISELIKVQPVSGPLLLDRLACAKVWNHGVNKGLCSALNSQYKGEFCENKIDLFQVPSQHLNSLAVYNSTSSSPIYSLPAGEGVANADFIMYVISHLSDFCLHEDVQAYASYCRLDQNGRPIAGFINFCPNSIHQDLNKKHMFHVSIHEIFHSLGFSKDLFSRFRNCDLGLSNCTSVKHKIIKDSHGIFRLNLPHVVEQMKKHFNCSDDDFGAPLETEGFYSYGSHWDPLVMFGSIMTSTVLPPQFTSVDPITLSVFADTGWYKVNVSNADKYFWGKGQGCNFGFEVNCGTGSYTGLCDVKTQEHSAGCDFWHHSISQCQKVKENNYCGLFKPNMEDQCLLRKRDKFTGLSSSDMRCFVTKENTMVQPICTAFSCIDGETNVWFNGSWLICPSATEIVVNESTLLCPKADSLCHPPYMKHPYTKPGKHDLLSPHHYSPDHGNHSCQHHGVFILVFSCIGLQLVGYSALSTAVGFLSQ